jgi:hypothetical protein
MAVTRSWGLHAHCHLLLSDEGSAVPLQARRSGFQECDAPRISEQQANESGTVVNLMHRPLLTIILIGIINLTPDSCINNMIYSFMLIHSVIFQFQRVATKKHT